LHASIAGGGAGAREQLIESLPFNPTSQTQFELLDDLLSVEPLGAVVLSGDEKFMRSAQWIFFVLIDTETARISGKRARGFLAAGADRLPLDDTQRYVAALGLEARWAERSVAAARRLRRDLRAQPRPAEFVAAATRA
jgi:hypothetical protein